MCVCVFVCVLECMVCVNNDMYELCCMCGTYHFLLRFFYFVIQYKFDLIMKLPNYLIQQLSPHLIKLFKKLDKIVKQNVLHTLAHYYTYTHVHMLNINKPLYFEEVNMFSPTQSTLQIS